LVLAWTGLSATGCLPAGDPPMGRQVIAGRDDLPAGLLPASPDGIVRLLVLRLDRERLSSDLYLVSVDGAAPATERLLQQNLGWSNGCYANRCFPTDRRGRVFVYHDYDPITSMSKVTRIDAVTGDQFELGNVDVNSLQFSPSGDRLAAFTYNAPGVTVYEFDDRATVLAGTTSAKFVGEDFYYVSADKRLMRLPSSGGEPEFVRPGVSAFDARETLAGPVLILYEVTADLAAGTVSFLDPVTLQAMFRPVELSVSFSVSPDRRWLLITDSTGLHYTFVDAMTGGEERFDAPAGAGWASVEWRPGRAEVWLQFYRDTLEQPRFDAWIKEPGSPPRVVPLYLGFVTERAALPPSFFTLDGSYVFSLAPVRPRTPGIVQIGSADDPTGRRVDIIPEGSWLVGYWLVADGRLVTAAAYSPSSQRDEIRVIDLARGESRSLATEASVLAVGQRRVLATAHVTDGFGDLRVIDLDSGASTVLGTEFVGMAFSEPRGPGLELVTPGSHVAFQFQGRFASPYDGIWVATVP
jgi:hypothetical protein